MNWEQKFQAMQALLIFCGDAALHMRKPGDWYMSLGGVDIRSESSLTSVSGSGKTPQEAVEKTWENVTILKPETYIVTRSVTSPRRAVKWNGFMWEDIQEGK
jgi:hypothetical protein